MAKFKMASAFPVSETTTIPKLAEASGLDNEDCTRLVRHAVASRLFLEPSPGVISHSGMSNAIANVPLLREWVEETCENMWSSGSFIVPAMEKFPGSEEPGQSAYSLSRKTDLSFFEDLGTDATGAKAKRFADAMSFFQAGPAMQTSLIVDNYDWKSYKTIVDVGGSHGAVMIELAKQNPEMKCVVQDLPEVISGAPKDIERVDFQPYNFFTEQPVKNADVYFFRMIFHNWGDKYCIQILKNLIPALKKGSRVVINDNVVPPGGVLSPYKDRTICAFDLVMKGCFNAKERSAEDWTKMLKAADERFMIKDVIQPKGSQLQIIDVQWDS
jgi:predicted O-methyltransferase YrrM